MIALQLFFEILAVYQSFNKFLSNFFVQHTDIFDIVSE